jgi:hypothetical protein
LINLKKKNKKQKSAVENRPTGENKIIIKQQKPANTTHPVQAKPAITRKPIIITKMKLKIAFFHFDCGTLFRVTKRVFDEYKSVGVPGIKIVL